TGTGAALLAAGSGTSLPSEPAAEEEPQGKMHLELRDFQPKSMLHVPQTKVSRSRFPVIDVHTHLSWQASRKNGVPLGEKMQFLASPEELLPVMDRKNIRMMVDLTGGMGKGLEETVQTYPNSPSRSLPGVHRTLVGALQRARL